MKNALALTVILTSLVGTSSEAQKPKVSAAASIVNSGSTNTFGYKVTVYPSGKAYSQVNGKLTMAHLPSTLTGRFFRDLEAAVPVSSLAAGHGMKSASFGTSTTVSYRGQQSPDLSSPAEAKGRAISADILEITKELKLANLFKRSANH